MTVARCAVIAHEFKLMCSSSECVIILFLLKDRSAEILSDLKVADSLISMQL